MFKISFLRFRRYFGPVTNRQIKVTLSGFWFAFFWCQVETHAEESLSEVRSTVGYDYWSLIDGGLMSHCFVCLQSAQSGRCRTSGGNHRDTGGCCDRERAGRLLLQKPEKRRLQTSTVGWLSASFECVDVLMFWFSPCADLELQSGWQPMGIRPWN